MQMAKSNNHIFFWSKPNMKKLAVLLIVAALASFSSCQKQQTEEERKAEIDREVQARLAAERQTQQQQELERGQADLEARERALAEKEKQVNRSAEAIATPSPAYQAPRGPEPHAGGSYSMFYTKLAPYGDWIETSDYGYVWHPYEADRSRTWRPYTDGRWVYSDVGWMWVSEEPFGWAAYHYGRWIRLRGIGWTWVPGDTWAPAWVSWRKSNDYVGWAPLPPEARFERRSGIHNWADHYYDIGPEQYCFVPTRQFGTQRVARAVVTPEQNVNIINQTVNVTNITYNNTTVVNYGPDYNELQRQTQQPIERLRVERRTNVNLESQTPQTVVKGEVVEVPAPVISKAQPAAAPPRVKEKIGKVTVERGWEGVHDPRAAETLRAKIKAESTPPPDAPPKTFVKPEQAPTESAAVTPTTSVPQGATTPSPRMPHRSPPFQSSATPAATAVATRPPHSAHPAGATSPHMSAAMTSPPAPAETTASPVASTPPGRRPLRSARGAVSTPTKPSPSKEGGVPPGESAPSTAPSLPRTGRHEAGEKTNDARKAATQQPDARRSMPATTAESSTPPTTSQPAAPASAHGKQPKREMKGEKKGLGRGVEANESPTPGG